MMRRKTFLKRLTSGILCGILLATSIPSSVLADIKSHSIPIVESKAAANVQLVNIASDCTFTVPSNEGTKDKLYDGNSSTLWVASGFNYPAEVQVKLPIDNMDKVKKIVIQFEKQAGRTVDVKLNHTFNGVVSIEENWVLDKEVKAHPLTNDFEFIYEEAQGVSDQRIVLSNPALTTGGTPQFWPAIGEIQVWVEKEVQGEDTSYTNIASTATVTSSREPGGVTDQKAIDDNNSTLYEMKKGVLDDGEQAYIQFDYTENKSVNAIEVAVENIGATDSSNFVFTYDILGKAKNATTWTTLVTDATANRTTKSVNKHGLNPVVEMASYKVVLKSLTKTAGTPWPALAEVRIFGKNIGGAVVPPTEQGIAVGKPVHTNGAKDKEAFVNDGNASTSWTSTIYPSYVDIDLEKNYNLTSINIVTPQTGYSQYTIYTSMDGKSYDRLLRKDNREACPATGITHTLTTPKEARMVRVYYEYNSNGANSQINEIRIFGTETGTPVQPRPAIDIPKFSEDTRYNKMTFTNQEVIEEVQAIVARTVGEQYINWFDFVIAENPKGRDYDYYRISNNNGKIRIEGNDGVSLATGLNHYYKYYCKVNIAEAQVPSQTTMPSAVVPVNNVIMKETKFPVRYSFNYCTQSYSMAFWGEEEWRKELDWLALNGVNLVLDIVGQEEVWRRFLGQVGYTLDETKDFLAGPSYYAWAYMQNLTNAGGPLPDTWFKDRTELARKNQLRMRKLGMEPIMQGFSGMMPLDIATKVPGIEVIAQGQWSKYPRPIMLKTETADFDKYARLFYTAQKEVFGDVSNHYATDPFHEGGNTGGMSPTTVATHTLDAMIEANPNAVWIIQGWQGNPSAQLLAGLEGRRDHALILDLRAERVTKYTSNEFNGTPWVFCMLNNFGGRMGFNGSMDIIATRIAEAANSRTHMKGIGITPEATQGNPMLYDFFYDTIWSETPEQLSAIDIDAWVKEYQIRRYGKENKNLNDALKIIVETGYNSKFDQNGDGAPESVINAQPAITVNTASTWGTSIIGYSKTLFEKAGRLLAGEYETFKGKDAYIYDLVDVYKQILSNSAQEVQREMGSAYSSKNKTLFNEKSEKFLSLIDAVDNILSVIPGFRLGTWTTNAEELATGHDDYARDLYLYNAKALVTTWGSKNQRDGGGLRDYSNRQWSDLTKEFYKGRWSQWIAAAKTNLDNNINSNPSINWFEWEWEWVRSSKSYSDVPATIDVKAAVQNIQTNYSVGDAQSDAETDDSKDISPNTMTTSGNQNSESETTTNVLDQDEATIWHTNWSAADMSNCHITFNLGKSRPVDGLRYKPRSQENGRIIDYKIAISNDNGATYKDVKTGTWANNTNWKIATFTVENATNVRLYAITARGGNFASASTIRLTQPVQAINSLTLNKTTLSLNTTQEQTLVATADPASSEVVWSTSKAQVASVDNTGKVTALSNGTAVITARAGDKTASCTVTVVTPPSGITLSKTAMDLKAGENGLLEATVLPASATNKAITWSSEKPGVATVLGGTVSAVSAGTTKITASIGSIKAECMVTVTGQGANPNIPVTEVTLSDTQLNLTVGAIKQITASIIPDNATNKTVTWASSSPTVATVQDGLVTAIAAGSTGITATVDGKSATCKVTVAPAVIVDDKTELRATLAEARAIDKSKYTPESYAKFKEEIDAAQVILDNPDASEKEIDEAIKDLADAKTQLQDYVAPPIDNTGWVRENNKERYYKDGVVVKNSFIPDGTNKYYADAEGYKTFGWLKVNNIWHFFAKDTGIMQTGWLKDGGSWYYLQSDGKMKTGWFKEGASWYYLLSSGKMAVGWAKYNNGWYYLEGSGKMKTGWLKNGGAWYFLEGSGKMKTGWLKTGGAWYYLEGSGKMKTGWLKDGGAWYYLQGSGKMKTGWLKDGGAWYYLQGSGKMKTGWLKDGGVWYYLQSSGKMKTGWVSVKGYWYYLKSTGVMATGWTYVDGIYYYLSTETGAWHNQTKKTL